MRVILDIETPKTVQDRIWLAVTRDVDTGVVQCHTSAATLAPTLEQCEQVIGHNLIGFDCYHLQNLWGVTIPSEKIHDTLILSRLYRPDLEGGHSLENWGRILKTPKSNYEEFDNPDLTLLQAYCEQDTAVNLALYHHLELVMKKMGFSDRSKKLEHEVAWAVQKQIRHGWYVDQPKLFTLHARLTDKLEHLEWQLQQTFPPTKVEMKTKVKYEDFNPGSRKQIAERLMARGWKPTEKTEKGTIIVDEEVLETLPYPEAKLLAEYFMVQKRLSQVAQWVKYLDDDGRIHGKVISNGAVTGRMTHSQPNLAQVPKASDKVPYGKECREIFTVPPPFKLVGVDASGLELRMLAHYINDPDYIHEVINGDVHTKNQKAAGLETRDQAKTFIYALLYGAGAEKIGSIAGGGAKKGAKLINSFLDNTPALAALKEKVARLASKGTLPGLDGRRLHVRMPHKALNTLLQGAGAILMKQALVCLENNLTQEGLRATIVGNIHDEFQIEAHREDAEQVGQLAVQSIEEAGVLLGLRCPVTGEFHVGENWAGTH